MPEGGGTLFVGLDPVSTVYPKKHLEYQAYPPKRLKFIILTPPPKKKKKKKKKNGPSLRFYENIRVPPLGQMHDNII